MTAKLHLRDRIIPWYFVLFFIVIATVNAVMVSLAINTYSGTVTDHPYEKGLAYNQVVRAEHKQALTGWKADINFKDSVLLFTLFDKDSRIIIPENAQASFTRPTKAGMDFILNLNGSQTPVTFPANGLWEVRVNATYKGQQYQQSKRIIVQ